MTRVTPPSQPDNASEISSERERIEEMINSPKMRDVRGKNRQQYGYVRPKNASTLILLDGTGSNTRVLMGRRNKSLKFMPGALVFPGGSVDRTDGSIPTATELGEITESRLISSMRGKPTRRGAKALAVAAVREVAEESGLLIGSTGEFPSNHTDWDAFKKHGVIPSISDLRLFSRAITPPGMSRRFDTWFFAANATSVGYVPESGFEPDGELEELQWIKPEVAIAEDTREITRVMLVELIHRLNKDPDLSEEYPAPFYHTVGNRFAKKMI